MLSFHRFLEEARKTHQEFLDGLVNQHKDMTFHHDPRNDHLHDTVWSDEHQKQVPFPDEKKQAYARHRTINDIVDHDPDKKNNSNTQWMIHQYKKGHYKQEDISRVSDQVSKFHKIKHTFDPDKRDLNRYTLHSGKEPRKISIQDTLRRQREYERAYPDGEHFTHKDAHEVPGDYDRSKLKVFELKSHEAAKGFRNSCGHEDNTGGWCTGWKDSEHYDEYKEHGPIYGVEAKAYHGHDAHETWRKFQIHHQSGQYMDKDDVAQDAKTMTNKMPELKKVHWDFSDKNEGHGFFTNKSHAERVMPFLHDRGRQHYVDETTDSADEEAINHIMDHYSEHIKAHHIDTLLNHHDSGEMDMRYRDMTKLATRHPEANQSHINRVWDILERDKIGKGGELRIQNKEEHQGDLVSHTKNLEHLRQATNFIDKGRSYGVAHIAGMRLVNEFGEKPPVPVSQQNKLGYERLTMAHNAWKGESEKIPGRTTSEKFVKYHGDMMNHYHKLAKESPE